MQDSKLVKIFKSLTTEEWKYLRWFVQSNFFNTDPNLLRLFEALAKYHPDFSSKTLTKEMLYNKVFAGQAYHDGKWRNLSSKMTKLMEDYLVWLELEQQETTRQKLLTAAYGRRNLFEQFEKGTNELSEKLEKQGDQSADALRERVLVNRDYFFHALVPKVNNLGRLQSAMDDLDGYYFSEKLRYACEFWVLGNMVTGDHKIRLINEVLSMAVQGMPAPPIYLELYAKIYMLFESNQSLSDFQDAQKLFSEQIGHLVKEDRQFGLRSLLNYAINQANTGQTDFGKVIFELYKLGLTEKILIEEDKISASTFINITSTGSGLKEFTWTAAFICEYESKIDKNVRDETITIGQGFLKFYQKDHTACMQLLMNFSFNDFNNILLAKLILIRCYYELFEKDFSYFNFYVSYSKALEKFIRREKHFPKNRKTMYLNFGAALMKMARLKYDNKLDMHAKEKIKAEFLPKSLILKHWLIAKLEE